MMVTFVQNVKLKVTTETTMLSKTARKFHEKSRDRQESKRTRSQFSQNRVSFVNILFNMVIAVINNVFKHLKITKW